MELWPALTDAIDRGGPLMWPILGLALLALPTCALQLWRGLRMRTPGRQWQEAVFSAIEADNLDLAAHLCAQHPRSAVAQMVGEMVDLAPAGRPAQLRAAHQAAAMVHRQMGPRWISLRAMAQSAVLCGVLGSVCGLFMSFGHIAYAHYPSAAVPDRRAAYIGVRADHHIAPMHTAADAPELQLSVGMGPNGIAAWREGLEAPVQTLSVASWFGPQADPALATLLRPPRTSGSVFEMVLSPDPLHADLHLLSLSFVADPQWPKPDRLTVEFDPRQVTAWALLGQARPPEVTAQTLSEMSRPPLPDRTTLLLQLALADHAPSPVQAILRARPTDRASPAPTWTAAFSEVGVSVGDPDAAPPLHRHLSQASAIDRLVAQAQQLQRMSPGR